MRRFAEAERLFRRNPKVLVALSGGPDSLACLLVLRELRETFSFELVAAHFNHMIRPESGDDLARVREICESLEIECLSGEGDVPAVARQQRRGVEEVGRAMRYQFLAFIAGHQGAGAIATGHTADDQVETVMMHVVRGTGVRGLRGMLPAGPVPGASAQRLVRPLLELGREDTEAICAAAGVTPIVDVSNTDTSFARNRLRHETLPALRALNPSLDRALLGLAANAREAFEPVERQSMSAQPRERAAVGAIFERGVLAALPTEALLLVVEREVTFFKLEPEVNRTRLLNLKSVLRRGSGEVRFGPVMVEASSGLVRIGPVTEAAPVLDAVVINVPGVTRAGDVVVTAATDPIAIEPGQWSGAVDMSAIRGTLRVRTPRPGDRIKVGDGTRGLQDFLVNSKTPRWVRRDLLAIADADGIVALPFGPKLPVARPGEDVALYLRVGVLPPPEQKVAHP